ncbi:twin-arginine translocase subunit TatB [Alcaligenaceae bacterium]|nr:twin-arginine translocase subunit TatB [Alcaligenaceae bacterium]
MFDVSFSELLLIGVIALIVIGPERLPKVARTVGHLLGRAQRYVSDVKTDIQREMELDSLTDLKSQMEDAAKSVKSSMEDASASLRKPLDDAQQALKDTSASVDTLVKDTKAQVSLSPEPAQTPDAAPAAQSASATIPDPETPK